MMLSGLAQFNVTRFVASPAVVHVDAGSVLLIVASGCMYAVIRSFSRHGLAAGLLTLLVCGVPISCGLMLLAPLSSPEAPSVEAIVRSGDGSSGVAITKRVGKHGEKTLEVNTRFSQSEADQPSAGADPQSIGPGLTAPPAGTQINRHRHSGHRIYWSRPERRMARGTARTALSFGSVGLFLYLVFLLLEGAVRGHFKIPLLCATAGVFVVTCLAILRFH